MATGLSSFIWHVPPGGFAWIPRAGGKLVLTERPPRSGAVGIRQYAPLKEQPALFRTFANLPVDNREELLDFANQFGNLGKTAEETLEFWIQEINALYHATTLWDMVRNNDLAALQACMRWDEGEYAEDGSVIHPRRWYHEFSPGTPRHWAGTVEGLGPEPGNMALAARFLVQQRVNMRLMQTSLHLLYDQALGRTKFHIIPLHLLAAMWLQFAEAITGNKQYKMCKDWECGKWFEISPDERTARRVFCGEPCKSRDYRRRKELAGQLKKEGKSVQVIAKELGTDLATIKKWLKQRRG
jgi:hypothetical protein